MRHGFWWIRAPQEDFSDVIPHYGTRKPQVGAFGLWYGTPKETVESNNEGDVHRFINGDDGADAWFSIRYFAEDNVDK